MGDTLIYIAAVLAVAGALTWWDQRREVDQEHEGREPAHCGWLAGLGIA